MEIHLPTVNNERGVSPVIGFTIITGFAIITAVGIFGYGAAMIATAGDEPREDANFATTFDIESDGDITGEIIYDTGGPFDPTNTERLFLVAVNPDGTTTEHTIYDGTEPQLAEIQEEDTVVSNIEEQNIQFGSQVSIVWSSKDSDRQYVIDEFTVEDQDVVTIPIDRAGTFTTEGAIGIT